MPSASDPISPATAPNARQDLYRAALGPVHAEHYLPAFARFDERGANGPTWNTAAALGNLGWLVYRQLWGAAGEFAVALGIWALIAFGLAAWVNFLPLGVRAGLALALLLLLLLVPGLYGTALLHAQVRRRMIEAVKQAATVEEACTLLRWQGDAERRRGAWGVAGLLLAAVVLAWGLWSWSNTADTVAASPAVEGSVVQGAAPAETPAESAPAAAPHIAATAAPPSADADDGEPAAAETPAPAVAASSTETAAEAQATNAPDAALVVPTPDRAAPATLGAPPAGVAVRVKGFGVSVGLFGVRANAERAQARLEAAGLPVLSDPIESARGPLTRVRVGPFDNREQAQAAADRVRALGLDARVYAP
jgi:cell division septation protein DedD